MSSEEEIYMNLTPIFREVFDEDVQLSPLLSAKDVEAWDSLGNIRLFVAIEQRLNIKFTTGEITSLSNVGELVKTIRRRLPG